MLTARKEDVAAKAEDGKISVQAQKDISLESSDNNLTLQSGSSSIHSKGEIKMTGKAAKLSANNNSVSLADAGATLTGKSKLSLFGSKKKIEISGSDIKVGDQGQGKEFLTQKKIDKINEKLNSIKASHDTKVGLLLTKLNDIKNRYGLK